MGGIRSRPEPTPPPTPTFSDPWRKISWQDKERDLQYVKKYQPQNTEVKHLRVLLYGPVGAGKSSFINSANNVLQGKMTTPALASSVTADSSFTKKYQTHKIPKENAGNFYPFVFNDIMGLEEGTGKGVSVEDLKLALNGHVKDQYKLNPVSPLSSSDTGYNPSPSPDDKVHVLVWVCSANVAEIRPSILQKMKDIREAASNMDIPQVALVTHVDEACAETEKDLKNVYRSKYLKKKMQAFSSTLGIPLNCILPVKNYSHEIQIDDDVDCLILSALRLIIDFGNDFINKM